MRNRKLLGNVLLLVTAMIWGTSFAFQRMGAQSLEPGVFNSTRMLLAALAVTPLVFLGKGREVADRAAFRKNTVLGGVLCGLCLASATMLQQIGMMQTGAGKAGFITAMYMLLVPILNLILFRKRCPLIVWLAVAAGIAGMYLLCINEGFTITRGDGLICICALLFSFHIICCDRFVKNGNPVGMAAIQFYVTAFISGVFSLLTEKPTWAAITAAAIPILFCGLGSGGIGYTLQIVAQKFTDPTVASILMSLESVFAVLGGALILGERMSMREAAGCVVMFIAVIMVQIPAKDGKDVKKDFS